ncbi:MAG: PA2779 family protein [Verrucomicrobiia bacterium]
MIMNTSRFAALSVVAAVVIGANSVFAAPCESVESAAASTAYQKVDAMLNEQTVASHLQAVGLSSQQAHARLSQLSDQQLCRLAAQADTIQSGGTIQGGNLNDLGPIGCFVHQLGHFLINVYHLIFCWGDIK